MTIPKLHTSSTWLSDKSRRSRAAIQSALESRLTGSWPMREGHSAAAAAPSRTANTGAAGHRRLHVGSRLSARGPRARNRAVRLTDRGPTGRAQVAAAARPLRRLPIEADIIALICGQVRGRSKRFVAAADGAATRPRRHSQSSRTERSRCSVACWDQSMLAGAMALPRPSMVARSDAPRHTPHRVETHRIRESMCVRETKVQARAQRIGRPSRASAQRFLKQQ